MADEERTFDPPDNVTSQLVEDGSPEVPSGTFSRNQGGLKRSIDETVDICEFSAPVFQRKKPVSFGSYCVPPEGTELAGKAESDRALETEKTTSFDELDAGNEQKAGDLAVESNYDVDGGDDEDDDEDVKESSYTDSLPEGVTVEWAPDRKSATLFVSDLSQRCIEQENRICLVGIADVEVTEGSAEILGHTISSDGDSSKNFVTVVSPFWSSWITLQATTLPCQMRLRCVRSPNSFRIVAPTRPIVIPTEWKTAAESIFDQFCSSSFGIHRSTALARASILDHEDDLPNNKDCQDSLYNHPRHICMITGGKGVGKSTFLRYLTNKILNTHRENHVAILDTDVGQPELAPPGLLRLTIVRKPLLHPPYWNFVANCDNDSEGEGNKGAILPQTHFETVSSIFFGAETSKTDPNRYIEAIQFLINTYEQKVSSRSAIPIPLLVNMDGWIKGLGFQILSALVNMLRPSHVVQILGDTRALTFDIFANLNDQLKESIQLYAVPACNTMTEASLCRIPSLTARNFRWATYFLPNMLSTFDAWNFVSAKDLQTGWITVVGRHFRDEEIRVQEEDNIKDECRLARALACAPPYRVPMEALEFLVVGSEYGDAFESQGEVFVQEQDRTQESLIQSMNGQIVALCTNTNTMESVGFGILRSVDWKDRFLYILVPSVISKSSLAKVSVIVKGTLQLPLAMLFRGIFAESFPYLVNNEKISAENSSKSSVLGSTPMRSRNNIVRQRFQNTINSSAGGIKNN